MVPLIAGIAIAGAVTQAWATRAAAKARADAARKQAELDNMKADEMLKRASENTDVLYRNTQKLISLQVNQQAGSGVQFGASTWALMEDTANSFVTEANKAFREAQWEASMTRMGADMSVTAAKKTEQAGTISALGGLAFQGASIYDSMPGGKTK